MTLKVTGIEVECVIGERPDERTRNQCLNVDVVLTVSDKSADTDELSDTVDYPELAERIRRVLVAAKCKMIERAAKVVCAECLTYECVVRAEASVTKTGAVANVKTATATFCMERSK